ncbi:hypothetical protein D3C81_1876750 [compost metagenome]
MDDDLPVCALHTLADVMPSSGRCRACIEESNAESRAYLETSYLLAQVCRKVQKYVREAQKTDAAIDHDEAIDNTYL